MKNRKRIILAVVIITMFGAIVFMGKTLFHFGEYENIKQSYTEQLQIIVDNYKPDYQEKYMLAKTEKDKADVRNEYEMKFKETVAEGSNELAAIHRKAKDSERHYDIEVQKYKEQCNEIINKGLDVK